MSSFEGEYSTIDVSSDESEGFAPAKPKVTRTKAAPTTKSKAGPSKTAATKPKTTKKVLVDHNDHAEDNAMEIDSDGVDDAGTSAARGTQHAAPGKKKSASETYQKLTQLEHILKRPDSYIGSVETITQTMWTYDAATKRMINREVKFVPGFYKIVDEILVNAADNKINDPSMDTIKVNINVEEGTISVYNNGRGIPIEMHSREKMYIPELIFGHLLSSSNYDDDEKKLTGGRNGYGAKLANIYSHEFTVETADKNSQQKYKQTWTQNMSVCGKAKITKNAKGEEWTKVSFKPDLARFGMDSIDEDTAALLRKRVYDMAGTVKDIKVFLNDERVKIKNFKQYVEMYLNSAQAEAEDKSGGAAQSKPTVIYEQINPRWEVAFAISEGSFQHVAFANSIATVKGGTHVTLISDQISKNLLAAVSKKNKAASVKSQQIKNHMWIFINALIENPTFDSQTKETLTLPASKFGTKPVLSEDFLKKVQKSPIIEHILNWAQFKADQQIKKTDGTKRSRLTGLPKLSDANMAGTKNAKDCTLILTEGDSAKTMAQAGLSVVGRNNFGIFPLRGKVLNVREAKHDQIMKNEEIQNIKKILGLQHNKEYKDVSSLRYGQLMLMTDQDHDGSHIKGLLINYLDHFYPSLLKLPGFLVEFVTPIVRITKGKQRKDFFTIPEYEEWVERTPDAAKWKVKYFKGLGTSKDTDAVEYFADMGKHVIPFSPLKEEEREEIDLAFSKKKADERKEWLRQFRPGTFLDHNMDEISYSEFINKELILFSMADNIRSIPSVSDGLKPGQRKIIWSCFKRNLKSEIKVAQLIGYVSEKSAYHHGEASLAATIVNLAQNFVGSNNINLLLPNGQFGSRDQGGKDHASPRYIFTEPSPITRSIFHPSDDALLNAQQDDGENIEPEWYLPVLPMILVNGAEGIGTGWSTNIPCFNPVEIVANLRRLMNDEEMVPMHPWWHRFTGEVKSTGKNKYEIIGAARKVDDTTVEVTELPIHKWTANFKKDLEAMMAGDKTDAVKQNYQEHHSNENVHFVIEMSPKEMEKAEAQGFNEYFQLTTKISTANMICFDFEGKIKKYDSPEAIMEDFYPVRMAYYQKRKDYLAGELQDAFERLSNQARFVQMIVDKTLVVSDRKKVDIVADLRRHEFRPFPKKPKDAKDSEDDDNQNNAAEEDEELDTDFDYLLTMPIYNLTKEKIDKLRQQAADKEAELLALLEVTPKQMWNEDLDKFLDMFEVSKHQREVQQAAMKASGQKGKKKQGTLKTRKSIGSRNKGSDNDEDFKPVKAAPKTKPASKSAVAKSAAKREDGDDDMPPAPAPKRAAAAKKKPKDESNDDFDISEVSKPAPRKKPVAKSKLPESDSDDDVLIVANTDKGKEKAKTAPKRKNLEMEEEEENDDGGEPVPKKKAGTTQSPVTDYFTKAGPSEPKKTKLTKKMKPASPPKAKKSPPKVVDSDDDDDMDYDSIPKPPRTTRPPRAAAASRNYMDVENSDEDGDDSIFIDED
ncbi:type II DNA topoisomerase [Guyanagaster necrorhizus]|uniref:DNA topoisomerase 2 n=1 Tax=Guyanagaster necrorhizus TaxID=856835 RepID=A0A9P7W240_9AGAR|nr:type II DNA topoisomerase [Guyanagaster necrorhizus MCA 3950]KAG7450762.1 type II DNA topoisomerase [Guyanagaster necrorhizus MCA 3950]